MTLSVEQADALRASLRFSCSRLSRMASARVSEPSKREWAAERAERLGEVLSMLDKGDVVMADETYNGWVNRETWAVALHLSNDQGLDEMVRELLAEVDAPAGSFQYGEALRDWFESFVDEFGDNEGVRMMVRDVGSTWRVEWQDVAESFMED